MEDTKKTNETDKPEELEERAPLTDEQLDQASGGMPFYPPTANEKTAFPEIDATVKPFD